MTVAVEVGIALSRPPRLDRYSRVLVSVDFDPLTDSWDEAERQAEWTALAIAQGRPEVVMAVSSCITEILAV